MTLTYSAYGMLISSDIALPELSAGLIGDGAADVEVRLGVTPHDGLADGKQIAPYIWAGSTDFLLEVPGIARFLVSSGKRIIVQPIGDIDEESVRVFLLGSAIGALLFQRGLFVLHGNGIEIDGKCLICVGPSGIGKSTLTAAFLQRGYRVLADDVMPIDGNGMAVPGFPRIKLWQDVADKLGIETSGLVRIRPNLEKFNLPLGDRFCTMPLPVVRICVLSDHHSDKVDIKPVTGIEKFQILQANTYRHRFMAGMSLQGDHLRQCGALAGKVSMSKVQRPKAGFLIDGLVDALLADLNGLK